MSTVSSEESIAIHTALIEEYALVELGFRFELNEIGFYILDGRLSYVSSGQVQGAKIGADGQLIIGRYRIARGAILYATREQLQETTSSTPVPLRH